MSISFILALNASLCLLCGLTMGLNSQWLNALFQNQHVWLMAPMGWALVVWGVWLCLSVLRTKQGRLPMPWLQLAIAGDYGWSLLVIVLVSFGQIIVSPTGIRIAFVTALLTAALGALQFRYFKLLTGKY